MPRGLPNLPLDSITANHFAIEIAGVEIAQFASIDGITSKVAHVVKKENDPQGGLSITISPGAPEPPTITLERGLSTSRDLWDWHWAMVLGKVTDARKEGSIVMKDFENNEVARFDFRNAWVTEVSIGKLEAGSNEVLPEKITIVCEHMERVA